MQSQSTEAIVLRCRDFQEADRLVTFFSRDLGKVTGFAKVAKKSKKRFGPVLEPAAILTLRFTERPGSSLVFLEQASLQQGLPFLFKNLKKMAMAWYFLELVELMTAERDPSPAKFDLLLGSLAGLENDSFLSEQISFFEYHLLRITGMEPEISSCMRCRRAFQTEENAYALFYQGGVVCHSCLKEGESFELTDKDSLKRLQAISRFEEKGEVVPSVRKLLFGFLEAHLIRSPKTISFLRRWPDLMPL
ncbi:MAG: DNA repair protein RecO [bacterium]|nr:DNA repair protein RecO [bacterium]